MNATVLLVNVVRWIVNLHSTKIIQIFRVLFYLEHTIQQNRQLPVECWFLLSHVTNDNRRALSSLNDTRRALRSLKFSMFTIFKFVRGASYTHARFSCIRLKTRCRNACFVTFTNVTAELLATFTKFSVVRQTFDKTLRAQNIANKGTTSNIWNLVLFFLNPPSFHILETSLSHYRQVNTSCFAKNAVFRQRQFLNQATYYQLEHRFGKVVFTAFKSVLFLMWHLYWLCYGLSRFDFWEVSMFLRRSCQV